MLKQLQHLMAHGVLRPLDLQFAKFIAQQEKNSDKNLIMLLSAITSHELGKGHVCIDIEQIEQGDLFTLPAKYRDALLELVPEKSLWISELTTASTVSNGTEAKPLAFDGTRLYLQRYWGFEQRVSNRITKAAQSVAVNPQLSNTLDELFARQYHFLFSALKKLENNNQVSRQQLVCDMLDVVQSDDLDWQAIDTALLAATKSSELETLDQLIPNTHCVNWQKVAAAVALTRRFSVISGGPGTGKTTTVTKLLASLVTQAQQDNKNIAIKLVAPTGKAAARLTESIGQAVQSIGLAPEVKEAIPTDASTLHRLLGYIPNQVDFRHNKSNPLHLDVLVVDEASMVDLPMMARLLDAVPEHARVILLGDKDQLASVEAGAVLGDICQFTKMGYSQNQAQQLSQLTGFNLLAQSHNNAVADSLCMLQKSYRFDARSGIGQLAKAINEGSKFKVEAVWAKGFSDIRFYDLSNDSYNAMITMMVNGYRSYLGHIHAGDKPEIVLKAFSKIQLLCAMREGDFGVVGLNQRIEKALKKSDLIPHGDEIWYSGRPVMVTQNDYGVGLYNGDIGIAMPDPIDQRLRVYFDMPDGSIRGVLPSQLPEHETVYAMTIHKSQGSEFEHTVLALPAEFSPILTRELIYTGVTRAKKKLDLFATEKVVARGVMIKTQRNSGLVSLMN
ncbi:exodeoxyribonuclease V subunit alpha [Aliivibrio sp. S4TY2]|uniref:exodeoxyribonuclease V subunit alpha n=1 Tax=unclassified Aliivibrio TaxID=2645654 RepID=UPI0023789F95|nr:MULTISPECIES: exodeoxyribonuclease V subunit alpha [unclassified Aliivibrio]MDD9157219.1 exodeoxyribonuclease V subunit alpha [Aliivibrio sp. S4TY2]MDD9160948.1 exodeoxyribonuclease V subunit alpha [Aliivibrio sp. S4TY1]MDD9165131.1 exodeoxyribonuclease V subunit alpha [Aliivibrio sp. S4MY2]MDD9168976.1 exodeoxyribonuclease V subunit alpha [Aliivibrio sp. S4MY4]MDD9185704.1 exodeoxyribonuclease V subunit alpha [Aliivibrio sp. S4MY3]